LYPPLYHCMIHFVYSLHHGVKFPILAMIFFLTSIHKFCIFFEVSRYTFIGTSIFACIHCTSPISFWCISFSWSHFICLPFEGLFYLMIIFSIGSYNGWFWIATNVGIMGIHYSTIATFTPTSCWKILLSFSKCFFSILANHSFDAFFFTTKIVRIPSLPTSIISIITILVIFKLTRLSITILPILSIVLPSLIYFLSIISPSLIFPSLVVIVRIII